MLFRKYKTAIIKQIRFLILGALFLVVIGFGTVNLITSMGKGSVILTLLTRSSVFLNLRNLVYDESARVRINELKDTVDEIKEEIILGKGLGDVRITRWRHTRQLTVDNSYVFLFWKMGIIGLCSFLLIYYILFKRLIALLKIPLNYDEKVIVVSTLWNFVGMLIIGLSNASVAHYRFISVWAIMMALIELIYRKYAQLH
ncbi:MAG: hypothetical protein ACPL28_09810 [bacterium]